MFKYSLFPSSGRNEELESMFNSMFESTKPQQTSYPATDIYPEEGNTVIEVACTGFKPNELSVSVEDGKLIIEGKKEKDIFSGKTEKEYVVKKIAKRDFILQYKLLSAIEEFTADLQYGILKIKLISKEKEKKSIKINYN